MKTCTRNVIRGITAVTADQYGNAEASERSHEPAITPYEEGDVTKK